MWEIGAAMAAGLLTYGGSLALFIVALCHACTARAGAYYSVAPFFGAMLAVIFGAPVTVPLIVAAALMAVGVGLHLTEWHEHEHARDPIVHTRWHRHDDEHHDHERADPVSHGSWHRHEHVHAAVTHTHPRCPSHHRHTHGGGTRSS